MPCLLSTSTANAENGWYFAVFISFPSHFVNYANTISHSFQFFFLPNSNMGRSGCSWMQVFVERWWVIKGWLSGWCIARLCFYLYYLYLFIVVSESDLLRKNVWVREINWTIWDPVWNSELQPEMSPLLVLLVYIYIYIYIYVCDKYRERRLQARYILYIYIYIYNDLAYERAEITISRSIYLIGDWSLFI